jgi:hypothetical protein
LHGEPGIGEEGDTGGFEILDVRGVVDVVVRVELVEANVEIESVRHVGERTVSRPGKRGVKT